MDILVDKIYKYWYSKWQDEKLDKFLKDNGNNESNKRYYFGKYVEKDFE